MKILYAEDDVFMIVLTQMALEQAGHSVRHCKNGLEVITLMRSGTYAPDLILTDFHMPGMNADEIVGELRQIKACATTPIIIMSGSLLEKNSLKAMDIIGLIDKMGDMTKLPSEIKRIMHEAGKAWI